MHHLIKLALVALATVAAYFVYGFTAAVAPWPVAVASAGSLVGTYLGLAFADIPARQRDRASRVALGAMLIEACYGTLYVLNLQAPAWFVAPPWFVAVPLAVLHGASFSVLAYFVSIFLVHEAAEDAAAHPAQELAQTLALVLSELRTPAQAALPEPQAVAARAEPQRTQRTVMPSECPACGSAATPMQQRTAAQHGAWKCKQCSARVSAAAQEL